LNPESAARASKEQLLGDLFSVDGPAATGLERGIGRRFKADAEQHEGKPLCADRVCRRAENDEYGRPKAKVKWQK